LRRPCIQCRWISGFFVEGGAGGEAWGGAYTDRGSRRMSSRPTHLVDLCAIPYSSRIRPAFVPRTTGRRQGTTGTAEQPGTQLTSQFRASSEVAGAAPGHSQGGDTGLKSVGTTQVRRYTPAMLGPPSGKYRARQSIRSCAKKPAEEGAPVLGQCSGMSPEANKSRLCDATPRAGTTGPRRTAVPSSEGRARQAGTHR
jgi:hypothetical protein